MITKQSILDQMKKWKLSDECEIEEHDQEMRILLCVDERCSIEENLKIDCPNCDNEKS